MIKSIIDKNKDVEINKEKLEKIKELFPNCFTKEGNLDIKLFEDEIKNSTNITREGYGLNFLGKNYAKLLASLDTETILVPDEEHNKKEENKNSQNIYISGDNIDALKHLVKSYAKKIKCIYIDPPYNTGNDGFVYNDKFNFTIEKLVKDLDISDEEAQRIYNMTNSKSSSHSAWLTFMYPRLYLAKQLLTDDGVMFISIDEHELHNQLKLIETLFGDENSDVLIWRKNGKQGNTKMINRFKISHEYIVVAYNDKISTSLGKMKLMPNWQNEYPNPDNDPRGNYKAGNISLKEEKSRVNSPNYYSITTPSGKVYTREWFISKEEFEKLDSDKVKTKDGNLVGRIYYPNNGEGVPALKIFKNEEQFYYFDSIIDSMGTFTEARDELRKLFDNLDIFDTPKPVKMIKEFIRISAKKDDIILDFFSGSSTTAHAVTELNSENNTNLKYIMVQLEEHCDKKSEAYKNGFKTIDEIGQERIKRAAKKIKEETKADIDYGYKHYKINDLNTKTLDKLEKFESNFIVSDKTLMDEFGKDTILSTWINEDGYGLTDEYETLDLEGYEAYKYKNTLYLLNDNLSNDSIKRLIDMYEDDFECNRIVLFGYSFTISEIQTLKDNIKQVRNTKNINIELITRY